LSHGRYYRRSTTTWSAERQHSTWQPWL